MGWLFWWMRIEESVVAEECEEGEGFPRRSASCLEMFFLKIIWESKLTSRSNGHGCMLQYALLHLFGFKLSIDDLKNFRVRLYLSRSGNNRI